MSVREPIECSGCGNDMPDDEQHVLYCDACQALEQPYYGDDPEYDPDYMCPNCVTPWKCNGPHVPEAM